MHRPEPITIVLSEQASAVEQYAARELKKYLALLYQMEAVVWPEMALNLEGPAVIIGHPHQHPWAADTEWPELSPDGFCLKTVSADPPVLVLGGGSGRGTLFAVYELVERWGVRFLLSGDVLPERAEPLRLTGFDETMEPAYALRAVRPMANLPEGAAAWSLEDFTQFIDQSAKLKFNAFVFVIMESGPWLDYEFRGMERPAGDIFYGYRFPIDHDFVGRELFPGESEFYSPVLARARTERERKEVGIDLVRAILAHCKSRDLLGVLTFSLLEPPTALKHKCNDWATLPLPGPKSLAGAVFNTTPAEEFGVNPEFAAWMNVLDPAVRELTAARVKALIDTYPEADHYHFWVSEHRAGAADCGKIFAELDAKYRLRPGFDFEKELHRPEGSPFDRERYENQMRGDLLFLYAFDQILNEQGLLKTTTKPEASIGIAGVMPQLSPVTTRVLPKGSVSVQFLDYGAHGPAERIEWMDPLFKAKVPATLEIGVHDDNDMYFPQVSVESIERIVKHTASKRLNGYVAALWQVRQADVNAAYLARASWRPKTKAADFYHEFLPRLASAKAAGEFEEALRLIERADREVRKGLLYGYAFIMRPGLAPVFIQNGVDRPGIAKVRPLFQAALEKLKEAERKSPGPHLSFWRSRTQFAVDWLDLATACADFGEMMGDKRAPGTPLTAPWKKKALAGMDGLIARARALIELIVQDAPHKGDLGQIASMNHHLLRDLLKLREEFCRR